MASFEIRSRLPTGLGHYQRLEESLSEWREMASVLVDIETSFILIINVHSEMRNLHPTFFIKAMKFIY